MNKFFSILNAINGITNAIVQVQQTMGSSPGKTKQSEVESLVLASLTTFEISMQKDIVDEKAFKKNLKKTIDGIVGMLKATKFWKEA